MASNICLCSPVPGLKPPTRWYIKIYRVFVWFTHTSHAVQDFFYQQQSHFAPVNVYLLCKHLKDVWNVGLMQFAQVLVDILGVLLIQKAAEPVKMLWNRRKNGRLSLNSSYRIPKTTARKKHFCSWTRSLMGPSRIFTYESPRNRGNH